MKQQKSNLIHHNVELRVKARIPTKDGEFTLHLYRDVDRGDEHMAFSFGTWKPDDAVLVRIHSECFTSDVLGSIRCDCGEQLASAISNIAGSESGILVYLRQEGRGIGLEEKLKAYNLQDDGMDTVDANIALGHEADSRDYGVGAAILGHLGVHQIRLLTNNPAKLHALDAYGINVIERVALEIPIHDHNRQYLETKVSRMNHLINLHQHNI